MKYRTAIFVGSMALLSFLLIGCESNWYIRNLPETDSERKCVERVQLKLISNTPKSLAGHDQDWDDAINAAHRVAVDTCCKPRLYEFASGGIMTGKFKER